jgi:hypothetical protein
MSGRKPGAMVAVTGAMAGVPPRPPAPPAEPPVINPPLGPGRNCEKDQGY